jgi:hypothetical protein
VESDLQITSLPDVAVADKSDDDTPEAPTPPKSNDGTLEIDHHVAGTEPEIAENTPTPDEAQPPELPKTSETTESEAILPEVPAEPTHTIEDVKTSGDSAEAEAQAFEYERTPPKLVTEPPTMGGMLTANSRPEALDPSTDPMSVHGVDAPLLSRPSFDSVELSSASPVISPKEQEEPRQDSAGSSPVTAPSYNSFLSSLPKQTTQLDDVLPETTDKPATEQDVLRAICQQPVRYHHYKHPIRHLICPPLHHRQMHRRQIKVRSHMIMKRLQPSKQKSIMIQHLCQEWIAPGRLSKMP